MCAYVCLLSGETSATQPSYRAAHDVYIDKKLSRHAVYSSCYTYRVSTLLHTILLRTYLLTTCTLYILH